MTRRGLKCFLLTSVISCASAFVHPARLPLRSSAARSVTAAARNNRGVVRMDFTSPQIAASQQELILAAVVLGEGIGNTLNTKPNDMKTTFIGGGGAVLLVAAYFLMGFNFQMGAYAAMAICAVLAVNFVFRLIPPTPAVESSKQSFIDADGELLPSPVIGKDGRTFGWAKEYAAICLAGCFFASLALFQAASYIET